MILAITFGPDGTLVEAASLMASSLPHVVLRIRERRKPPGLCLKKVGRICQRLIGALWMLVPGIRAE